MRDAEHRREENFQSGPPCAPADQKQDSRCFSLLALLITRVVLARLSARVRGRLLLPNERFRRSEPRCLGVRPQMTGRSEEGARCRPSRGERRWNGGRLCVFGASIFRSDGVCQLGTERIRRATSIEFSVAASISDAFRSHCEEGTLLGTRSV